MGTGTLLFVGSMTLTDLMLPLGGVLIVASIVFSLRKTRQRQAHQQHQPITREETVERARQARGMRGDLEDLMVEIEELARRFSAQLDAKSMHLEKLIDQADQRLQQLKAAQQRLDRAADLHPNPPHADDASTTPRFPQAGHEPGEGPGRSSNDAATSHGAGTTQPEDPLTRRVYDMADMGMPSEEIAKTLDEHVGKVELILALRSG